MSGPFAVMAAATYPRMKAAAALYGVDMVTDKPDSPHKLIDEVKGELYIGFAEVDPAVPATRHARRSRRRWTRPGTKHAHGDVPGTHHGYCFAARADYNPVAAEATWTKLFALWDRNLK